MRLISGLLPRVLGRTLSVYALEVQYYFSKQGNITSRKKGALFSPRARGGHIKHGESPGAIAPQHEKSAFFFAATITL